MFTDTGHRQSNLRDVLGVAHALLATSPSHMPLGSHNAVTAQSKGEIPLPQQQQSGVPHAAMPQMAMALAFKPQA